MRRNNTLIVLVTVLLLAGLLGAAAWRQEHAAPSPALPDASAPEAAETPVSPYIGKLVITELMEKNKSVAADEDGDFSDWIELYNASDETLDLEGFYLADGPDQRPWVFPKTGLLPGDRMLVFADRKDRRSSVLHTSFGLSEGECVCLWDRDGLPVDTAETGGCGGDVSMALLPDGSWAPCTMPTPGYENSRAGYERYQQTLWPNGALVINEVAVANFSTYYFGYRDDCDWVEIKNVSDRTVNLGGCYLSDQEDDRLLYRLPDQELAPGGLLVVACDDDPRGVPGSTPCTGFALDSTGFWTRSPSGTSPTTAASAAGTGRPASSSLKSPRPAGTTPAGPASSRRPPWASPGTGCMRRRSPCGWSCRRRRGRSATPWTAPCPRRRALSTPAP